MNRLLLSCAFVALLVLPSVSGADVLTGIVGPYLRIQMALATDSLDGVNADAARIASETRRMGPAGKALRGPAAELAGVEDDIAAARAAFAKLSDALIQFAETDGPSMGGDLHVVYCPMEKKSWVQKGTDIMNPFAGTKMQKCGEVVKDIK